MLAKEDQLTKKIGHYLNTNDIGQFGLSSWNGLVMWYIYMLKFQIMIPTMVAQYNLSYYTTSPQDPKGPTLPDQAVSFDFQFIFYQINNLNDEHKHNTRNT